MPRSCRCESGLPYDLCCRPFHLGQAYAPTAERLMRSRYCAFVLGDEMYLRRTWHPSTCPASIGLDPEVRWTGLTIVSRTGGGLLDPSGTVAFVAGYRRAGVAGEQREHSRFVRENGRWLYLGVR